MDQLTITEQIYLIAIVNLKNDAYGVKIREKIKVLTGKTMAFGTLYNNLDQLVRKKYVLARKSEPGEQGSGNRRVFYTVSPAGLKALKESRSLQQSLWASIPENSLV